MAANLLLEYPELPIASVLSLAMLVKSRGAKGFQWSPLLASPAVACLNLLPARRLKWTQEALTHANWRSASSMDALACWKLYPALASMLLVAVLPLPWVMLAATVLWFIPDGVLSVAVQKRRQEIRTALPQALDLMILCVDAGMGLDSSLHRLTGENTAIGGALNEEMKILAGELLLGMDRDRAYESLYVRTGVDELRTLGSALTQANRLGLSVVKILRVQSDFIRKKQSQKAEERALKTPILMAFPLWFFIMPSLMLLVLGPSLINFYHQLHGSFGK